MSNYSYLFEEVIPASITREKVKLIIPILVEWAKAGASNKTYGDLNKRIGYKSGRNSSIGHMLGTSNLVLKRLHELTGEYIPTPNSLVCNAKAGIPSDGLSFVIKEDYDDMPKEIKKELIRQLNSEAIHYDKWDWVLSMLGLKASVSQDDIDEVRSGKVHGYSGEGNEHKQLKEYVASHPEIVGAKEKGVTEHILLSGDRLDVWFPDSQIAVEIKPSTSPDSDILRGLFQCVKYKATLDAEAAVYGEKPDAKVVLVIGGKLSKSNKEVQRTLGVDVKEVLV
ncbi:MAG: hypothetical protein K2G76_08800 [Prevotella sp.]|nr:hypothetical protein [Prevotella sp.]